MSQMRDLGMMVYGSPGDTKLLDAMMERLNRRVDDAELVSNLAEGRVGVKYVITRTDTSDPEVIRLCTLGFVIGALVSVVSRTGDSIEIDMMGSKCAIRNEQAKRISVMRYPDAPKR